MRAASILACLLTLAACSADAVQHAATALDLGGSALVGVAPLIEGDACVGMVAGGALLRGGAVAVRTRGLPAVALDLSVCGPVEPVRVQCEIDAWLGASTAYAAQASEAVLGGLAAPGSAVVVAGVPVRACR